MVDFLRFSQPAIIATVGGILLVAVLYFIVAAVIKRSDDNEVRSAIKWVRVAAFVIACLLVVSFFWHMTTAVSVNEAPRSVIDRSGVDFDRYSPKK